MAVLSPERSEAVLDSATRPLRIGMVAPPWFAVPPVGYGGIEAMVAGLVDGLVSRGHHVSLVAAGPPGTKAQRFYATYGQPPSQRLGDAIPEVIQAAEAAKFFEDQHLDIIHDHTLAGPLLARARSVPTVVTAHGPVSGEPGDYLVRLGTTVNVVAISGAQRRIRPEINWVSTVHNCVDVDSFPFGSGDGGYLLFIGRFHPDKGAHLAIDAARQVGRRLLLAGKLNEPAEREYFAAAVAPKLGPDIEYIGEADAVTKRELYAGASALLFPVQWEEPFGMVMVEAMACGTPVVALRRGSVPEVVIHGETGIIVDDPAQLAAAISSAERIDRRKCRLHAVERFDVSRMVAEYERVYLNLVGKTQLQPRLREVTDPLDPATSAIASVVQARVETPVALGASGP